MVWPTTPTSGLQQECCSTTSTALQPAALAWHTVAPGLNARLHEYWQSADIHAFGGDMGTLSVPEAAATKGRLKAVTAPRVHP